MDTNGGTDSPVDARDPTDPGDQTLRNFRYQHAYGVILLVGSCRGALPYISVWCEQHEDFLAERQDGLFSAYQIKTATPENGPWVWKSDPLRDSVKRFVRLHQKYPTSIADFSFVSNVEYLNSQSKDQLHRSPPRLLEVVNGTIPATVKRGFDDLRSHCACPDDDLRYVLRRMKFIKGPGRNSFADEIAHSHFSVLTECRGMTAAQRDQCLDNLIQIVSRASSLAVSDPSRHWCAVNGGDRNDPYLRAKRVLVESVREALNEMAGCPFNFAPSSRSLQLGNRDGKLTTLEKKLVRGGLAEYVGVMRDRAVSAERHLLELAHLDPQNLDAVLNQITSVVQGECDEARLDASQTAAPYGPLMLSDVHRRLRAVAKGEPAMVYRQPYELLAGVAGLLTEDCHVWWSERFNAEEQT